MIDLQNAHPDPQLVRLFREMRRADPTPTELAETFVIQFCFDGAGSLPTSNAMAMFDLGQIKARITGAVIVANGAGSCTIDLRHGTFADIPNLALIYGTGTIPTLTADTSVVLDVTAWTKYLQPADQLQATLKTVSSVVSSGTGALTSITLSLQCRRLKWTAGGLTAIDSSGDIVVDSDGNVVTQRS